MFIKKDIYITLIVSLKCEAIFNQVNGCNKNVVV